MKPITIGFIGGGRITRIFLHGFQNKQIDFKSIKVYDHNSETLEALKNDFPDIERTETPSEAAKSEVIVIAVHPPLVMEVLDEIAGTVNEKTYLVSLAPKITIARIQEKIKIANIVRMIPNATSYINKGFNPAAFHDAMLRKEKKFIKKLFKPLGKLIETEEYKLEGYAVISGMLPTYFWFQWQELENIAQKTGLSPEEAKKAIRSTIKRAVDLYFKSGLTSAEVMDLIPVKPLSEDEEEIRNTLNDRLLGLYDKIKPAGQ
ncbi:MAG: pyrroline-5-carboxylate reductase family protein [Bacteroidota bacterium]